VRFVHTVNIGMFLDGPAMADGAVSVGFSGRHGFRREKLTIRDEVGRLIAELQTNGDANHAMQATPARAPDG
jgi:hypothetical protein